MTRKHLSRWVILMILTCLAAGCGYAPIRLNPDVPILKRAEPDYPKAIVVYDSRSGNTAMIAGIIAGELKVPAVHVDQISGYVMTDFDLIVVGSPVHGGRPTKKISAFLSGLSKPPLSAVFVTFGAPLIGPMTANACLNKMEKSLQGSSLGRFRCHGFHKIIRTYPGHPDEKDRADARQFAAEILNRCRNNG